MKPINYCNHRKCVHLQRGRCALTGNVVDAERVERCKASRYFREDAPNPLDQIKSGRTVLDTVHDIVKF
jgi:hypothetical protein